MQRKMQLQGAKKKRDINIPKGPEEQQNVEKLQIPILLIDSE